MFFGLRFGFATIGSLSLILTTGEAIDEGILGTGVEDSILSTVGAIAPTVTGSVGCAGASVAGEVGSATGAGATGATGAGAGSAGAAGAAGADAGSTGA